MLQEPVEARAIAVRMGGHRRHGKECLSGGRVDPIVHGLEGARMSSPKALPDHFCIEIAHSAEPQVVGEMADRPGQVGRIAAREALDNDPPSHRAAKHHEAHGRAMQGHDRVSVGDRCDLCLDRQVFGIQRAVSASSGDRFDLGEILERTSAPSGQKHGFAWRVVLSEKAQIQGVSSK